MRRLDYCFAIALAVVSACSSSTLAVAPDLQDAYWRFEAGPNGSDVAPGTDVVLDSANANHLNAFAATTVPTYTNTVAPFVLRSGLPDNLALDFQLHLGGGDDLYTVGKTINEGLVPAGGGFTLEAAFRPDILGAYQAIVAKEGIPTGAEPTLALKLRGDSGKLQFEQFDKSGARIDVQSTASLVANEWYAAAVVNTGTSLSLYLRRQSDADYVFQGSTVVTGGALYQGPNGDSWNKAWSIGRAVFGGGGDGAPADWFDGIIDEVRLTARPLATNEFLFEPGVPEPGGLTLAIMVGAGIASRRGPRRKRA